MNNYPKYTLPSSASLYSSDGKILKNTNLYSYPSVYSEINIELDRQRRRQNYKSLEEFANEEGIGAVLEFLSRSPTQIFDIKRNSSVYRHTKMPCVDGYQVTKRS